MLEAATPRARSCNSIRQVAPAPWLPLPTLQPWEAPVARYAPVKELCRVQFKGKNHDACQNGPHFGAMLGYAHWLDATLQVRKTVG